MMRRYVPFLEGGSEHPGRSDLRIATKCFDNRESEFPPTRDARTMRFRIPPQLKETVTIVRKSAYEHGTETTIAADVVCMVVPQTDIVEIVDGVGISDMEWAALLEVPNADISEGDIIRRADETELQIRRIRALGSVLQLELKQDDIVI